MGAYKYFTGIYKGLRKKLKTPEYASLRSRMTKEVKEWRESPPIVRVISPSRQDKAAKYGYKAKQNFVVVRARIRKGGRRKSRPNAGRKPAGLAIHKITPVKSIQKIAEERVKKRYPNLGLLGSYWLWEDGRYKWYEMVMVDSKASE